MGDRLSLDELAAYWASSPWFDALRAGGFDLLGAFRGVAEGMREARYGRGTILGSREQAPRATPLRLILHGRLEASREEDAGEVTYSMTAGTILGVELAASQTGMQPALSKVGVSDLARFKLRASTDLWLIELDEEALQNLNSRVTKRLVEIHTLYDLAPQFLLWLQRSGHFAHLSGRDLLALLPSAMLVRFKRPPKGKTFNPIPLPPSGAPQEDPMGLLFVGHGQGAVHYAPCPGKPKKKTSCVVNDAPVAYLSGGTGYGLEEIVLSRPTAAAFPCPGGPVNAAACYFDAKGTRRPSRVVHPYAPGVALWLPRAAFDSLGVAPQPPDQVDPPKKAPIKKLSVQMPKVGGVPHRFIVPLPHPRVLPNPAVEGDYCPSLPSICEGLAEAIARTLRDRVLVLRIKDKTPVPKTIKPGQPYQVIDYPYIPRPGSLKQFAKFDVVIIDATELLQKPTIVLTPLQAVAKLVDILPGPASIPLLFDRPADWEERLALLGGLKRALLLPAGVLCENAGSTLLGPRSAVDNTVRGMGSVIRSLGRIGEWFPGTEGRRGKRTIRQEWDAVPPRAFLEEWPIDAVRLQFWDGVTPGLKPGTDLWLRSFERMGRACTKRKVGVAIGGGGALSLSALPLLRGLAKLGIPVDGVTGTSGGAMVAAFYAADGEEGLRRLMRHRYALSFLLPSAFLTNRHLGWWLDGLTGWRDLNQLTTPLHVLATDASTGEGSVVRRGTPGMAVRASGSVPPFAPTVTAGQRLLDGAYADNIPGAVLRDADFELVVGANPYPRLLGYPTPPGPGLPQLDMLLESAWTPRMLDMTRTQLKLWAFGAAQGAEQIDVEMRTPVGAEFSMPAAWGLADSVVSMAARSWELRVSLARVQKRWRESLREAPNRWSLHGEKLVLDGVFCFDSPPFLSQVWGAPLEFLPNDDELLNELFEFLVWLEDNGKLPPNPVLRFVGTWDVSLRPFPLTTLLPPLILAEYVRRRNWAREAAKLLERRFDRIKKRTLRSLKGLSFEADWYRGDDTDIRCELVSGS